MGLVALELQKDLGRHLRAGHPWVFSKALANRPRVLLADEPTANLDSKLGKEVAELLRRAASRTGAAVLMVSHDARIVDAADRLLLMEDGHLQAMG